jgi:uncharacterized membrane protein
MPNQNLNEENKWQQDPANWKWGIFYFNKSDHRIFPPKRIKEMGWTINFANPYVIVVLFLLISILVIWNCL